LSIYVDTSLLVAALDVKDHRQAEALSLLEKYRSKVASELVLIEMASVLSRDKRLLKSLSQRLKLSEDLTLIAVLIYLLKMFKIKYAKLDLLQRSIMPWTMYQPFATALELSTNLKMKTLDLLHLAYIQAISKTGEPVTAIATADRDFKKAQKQITKKLGIKVIFIE